MGTDREQRLERIIISRTEEIEQLREEVARLGRRLEVRMGELSEARLAVEAAAREERERCTRDLRQAWADAKTDGHVGAVRSRMNGIASLWEAGAHLLHLRNRGAAESAVTAGDVYEMPGAPVYWTITHADGRYITAESDDGSSIGSPMPWTPPATWTLVRRGGP